MGVVAKCQNELFSREYFDGNNLLMKLSGLNDQHVELDYFQKVASLKQT
jgi:hypothetical protein